MASPLRPIIHVLCMQGEHHILHARVPVNSCLEFILFTPYRFDVTVKGFADKELLHKY